MLPITYFTSILGSRINATVEFSGGLANGFQMTQSFLTARTQFLWTPRDGVDVIR